MFFLLCSFATFSYSESTELPKPQNNSNLTTTKSMGFSYPLIASISGGVIFPIINGNNSDTNLLKKTSSIANIDLGLGGGMVSAGLYFPINRDETKSFDVKAIIVKAAMQRTWLIDSGSKNNKTYTGGVVEYFGANQVSAKIGLGYFLENNSSQSSPEHLLYIYVGLGL